MRYLKEYGAQLVALGYSIIPLPPGTKGPRKPGWQKIEATRELVDAWLANGSADDGIGVLAAHTPAIDVDILDEKIAEEVRRLLERHFGPVLHTRIGMAPKFLVPFRCDTPFKKISSDYYYDPLTDTEHHVEILADGQQWVAYHQHPDTLQPYTWPRGNLTDLPYDQLPVLSEQAAAAFVAGFETIASRLVGQGQWEKKHRVPATPPKPPADDPLMSWKPAIDFKTLKAALAKIPNKDRHELDYDAWRNIIFAIHRETQGADHGLQLAHAWSARSGKYDRAFLDEHVWPYIHSDRPGAVTGLTILKLARQHGWDPDAPAPRAPVTDDPYPQYAWSDYQQGFASLSWIVKGVLPQAEFGVLYGASGSGKTFFALDLAATIARGGEWRGRKTNAGAVVYVAAEAQEGIKKRLAAYDQQFGTAGNRPRIMPAAPNLLSAEDADAIVTSTNLRGGASLIVIDTMAASHTGDENSTKDMGIFIGLCKYISQHTGAMVLVVHHTGKDDTKGLRGSSAIYAAADVVIEVFKNQSLHAAKITKQKDGEVNLEFGFTLPVIEVGQDQDGDPITTCVVQPSDDVPAKAGKEAKVSNFNDPRYDFQRAVINIFAESLGDAPDAQMQEVELIEAIQVQFPDKRSDNIHRALLRLVKQGIFYMNGSWIGFAGDAPVVSSGSSGSPPISSDSTPE
jgi:hypothetical protein